MPLTVSKLGQPLTDYMLLNVTKCKELVTSFSKTANNFPSLNSNSIQLSGFPFSTTSLLIRCHRTGSKRVLAIIYPNINYAVSLDLSGILKLSDRRLKAYDKLFNDIVTTPSHNLGHLQPERHIPRYNLRQTRFFVPPRAMTCRFTNTFIPSSIGVYNES